MGNVQKIYECDGAGVIWAVPFVFGESGEIGVRRIHADGLEEVLEEGRDYVVSQGRVVCVSPAGTRLCIYLKVNPQKAGESASRLMSAGGICGTGGTERANNSAMAASVNSAAPAYAGPELAAGGEEAAMRAENSAMLAQAAREDARIASASAEAARARAEVLYNDTSAALDETRRMSAKASEAAEAAGAKMAGVESLQRMASEQAAMASENCRAVMGLADTAREDAETARQWAEAAKRLADSAWQAACDTSRHAASITGHDHRPGICAVHSIGDIHATACGMFIVNPHITHAPTPFMGIWPACHVDAMTWDGVFFISSCKYPENPALPPELPPKPAIPGPAEGDSDDWLPCGHAHQAIRPSLCMACRIQDCKHRLA